MKKILFIALMLLGTLFVSQKAVAQASSYTSLEWIVGIPTGSLEEHTSNVSGRGMGFEYQQVVAPNISVGFNFSYSVFYEDKPFGTYTNGSATLSGYQFRYNNLFPISVNGQYHFDNGGKIVPYIGLGVGAIYDLRNTDMGLYTIEEENWQFLMAPDFGLMFRISENTGVRLHVKYDYAFKASGVDSYGKVDVGLGFTFM